MHKYSKGLLLSFLMMTSILLPILASVVVAETTEEEEDIFTIGACGPRGIGNWDTPCVTANIGNYYEGSALESLFDFGINATGELDELIPILATEWSFGERPDEMTDAGFMAYDGIEYMDITLRTGVTFHDGSNWNATVCKWNIDRIMYILGNINGCIDSLIASYEVNIMQARAVYYLKVSEWEEFATASWNASKFYGNTSYADFGESADYTDRFPRFANVTILENAASGGRVRVYFNDYRTGPLYLRNIRYISMQSYEDYFDVPIYGYGQTAGFPQDDKTVFPGHLIGTGPYIFEEHDVANDEGTMIRFENWWNSSAQQAQGYHKVDKVVLTGFPHSEAGYGSRNLALVTGEIDYARDRSWEPLDAPLMIASPGITYEELGLEPYGEVIVLNCVNETFWRYWSDANINVFFDFIPESSGGTGPNFVPSMFKTFSIPTFTALIDAGATNRAFRKALSYAFDYDTFVHTVMNDRIVRSGGLLGKTHQYYNPTIPLADTDLTVARLALINDSHWGPIVVDRELTIANSTDDWNEVAEKNPIYEFEYNWDAAHISTRDLLRSALEDIGCGMILEEDLPDTSTRFVDGTYTFPYLTTDGWALKVYHQRYNDLGYMDAYFHSPGIVEQDPTGSFGVISDWYMGYATIPFTNPITEPKSLFPYVQGSNLSFNYNETCDTILDELWFANNTREEELYDELTEWSQTFQYQHLWLGNDKTGQAMTSGWDVDWLWETFRFNLVKQVGGGGAEPIPGYSIGIVISVSLIALFGIAYSIMRKKRNA
ncbi:MAG: ABC transporter substrate-binding protein [Promethearchaeota archaeon]